MFLSKVKGRMPIAAGKTGDIAVVDASGYRVSILSLNVSEWTLEKFFDNNMSYNMRCTKAPRLSLTNTSAEIEMFQSCSRELSGAGSRRSRNDGEGASEGREAEHVHTDCYQLREIAKWTNMT